MNYKCWPNEDCKWIESEKEDALILTCEKCGTVESIKENNGEILREVIK